MAHDAVTGHLGKGDFSQQLRPQPVHTTRFGSGGRRGQGRAGDFQGLEPGMDAGQCRGIEAGTDLPGIAQLATVIVVQGQQQGTEAAAAAFGVGVADNHEFLALLALELDPVRATAAAVDTVSSLADQAFQLQPAGTVEQ